MSRLSPQKVLIALGLISGLAAGLAGFAEAASYFNWRGEIGEWELFTTRMHGRTKESASQLLIEIVAPSHERHYVIPGQFEIISIR